MKIGLPNFVDSASCCLQRNAWRRLGGHCARWGSERWCVLMGVQMKNKKLVCPTCGHKYLALFLRARSICPECRSEIQTDLRVVSVAETIIGGPLLWLLATLLRTHLHDEAGLLSYALLVPAALAVHCLVVQSFVKARLVSSPPSKVC